MKLGPSSEASGVFWFNEVQNTASAKERSAEREAGGKFRPIVRTKAAGGNGV